VKRSLIALAVAALFAAPVIAEAPPVTIAAACKDGRVEGIQLTFNREIPAGAVARFRVLHKEWCGESV
jgi:hypothetical protein